MAAQFRAAIDGGSRGNPGPAAWGVAILDDDGEFIDGHHGTLGHATNNFAEYRSLIEALKLARGEGATDVVIQADSELIVRQIQGRYRVRHPDLKLLFAEAKELIGAFESFRIRHVRREHNKEADRLVNVALDHAQTASETPGP
jgi:ribonuclease HI